MTAFLVEWSSQILMQSKYYFYPIFDNQFNFNLIIRKRTILRETSSDWKHLTLMQQPSCHFFSPNSAEYHNFMRLAYNYQNLISLVGSILFLIGIMLENTKLKSSFPFSDIWRALDNIWWSPGIWQWRKVFDLGVFSMGRWPMGIVVFPVLSTPMYLPFWR